MTEAEIEAAAVALFDAERARSQIPILSLTYPGMDMEAAYAVQARLIALKIAAGAKQKGWKIGLTSRAMQAALGIDIPDSGVLFDDMFFEHGGVVPKERFIQTRIEAEIAFVMKAPLEGRVSVDEVRAATDYVVPALEILDTRIERVDATSGKTRKVFDTIADNAANAGIVLGDKRHAVDAHDLRWVGAIVSSNGVVEETGLGAGVLNDPALGIAWLAERLATQGARINAGDVVLSGSFIRPIEARSGDQISADYGPFGRVDIGFE